MKVIVMKPIATHKLYVNTTEKPQADNSQNQGDNGNGGGSEVVLLMAML